MSSDEDKTENKKDNRQAAYNHVPATPPCLENSQDKFKMLQSSCMSLRKSLVLPELGAPPLYATYIPCEYLWIPVSTCVRTPPTLLKLSALPLTYKLLTGRDILFIFVSSGQQQCSWQMFAELIKSTHIEAWVKWPIEIPFTFINWKWHNWPVCKDKMTLTAWNDLIPNNNSHKTSL